MRPWNVGILGIPARAHDLSSGRLRPFLHAYVELQTYLECTLVPLPRDRHSRGVGEGGKKAKTLRSAFPSKRVVKYITGAVRLGMRGQSRAGKSASGTDDDVTVTDIDTDVPEGPARYSLLWPMYTPFAASRKRRRPMIETETETAPASPPLVPVAKFDVDTERLRRAREYEETNVSGPRESVVILREKGIRTLGLFAKTDITKGSIIGFYMGVSLSRKAFNRRYPRGDAEFVLQLDDEYIDASNALSSTKMRYINCPRGLPGVSANVYFYEDVVKSSRDIAVDEELFIDYGKSFHV